MRSSVASRPSTSARQKTRRAYSRPTSSSSAISSSTTIFSWFFAWDSRIACCMRHQITWRSANRWWTPIRKLLRTGSSSVSDSGTFKSAVILIKIHFRRWLGCLCQRQVLLHEAEASSHLGTTPRTSRIRHEVRTVWDCRRGIDLNEMLCK